MSNKLALLILLSFLLVTGARADNILIQQPNGTFAIISATCSGTPSICTINTGSAGSTGTPTAFSGLYAITTGGTSQTLAAANEVAHDCVIQNPATSTAQGIVTAESLFVNFVTAATLLSGGTTIELTPGVAIGCGGKNTIAISVNATTSAHKFSGYWR